MSELLQGETERDNEEVDDDLCTTGGKKKKENCTDEKTWMLALPAQLKLVCSLFQSFKDPNEQRHA